jgi:hypothetical protein
MKPSERLTRPAESLAPRTPPKGAASLTPSGYSSLPPAALVNGAHLKQHSPPRSAPSSPPLGAHSPSTINSRLATPSSLTPGPRSSSRQSSPQSSPPKDGAVPPLLRPGGTGSPPKSLYPSRPVAASNPVRTELPDPWDTASYRSSPSYGVENGPSSPPVEASAYPPSQGALGLLPHPSGPPARPSAGSPSPSQYSMPSQPWQHPGGVAPHLSLHPTSPPPGSEFTSPSAPWQHRGGGSPHPATQPLSPPPSDYIGSSTSWQHPGGAAPYPTAHMSSPPPSDYNAPSAPWQHLGGVAPHPRRPSGGAPSPAFPTGAAQDSVIHPPNATSNSYNGYSGGSPGYSAPNYDAPPSFPMAMPSVSTPTPYDYNLHAQSSPPARAYSPAYAPDPQFPGAYMDLSRPPPGGRPGYGFPDESGMSTPKAELQPRHQPAQPSSHLRREAASGSASGSGTSSVSPAQIIKRNKDEEIARELERAEKEAERKRKEDEERDLELARELDRALNASQQ